MHGSLDDLKVEVDMLAPGGERLVGKNPPLDIIARDIIFGEGPGVGRARQAALLHRHHRRHDLEVEAASAGWKP